MRTALRGAFTPARRRWLYGIGVTLTPLVVFYGLATQEEAALWLALGSAALNGLALANTPTPEEEPRLRPVPDDALPG